MTVLRRLAAACILPILAACAPPAVAPDSDAPKADPAKADAVMRIVRETMAEAHLKAVIVRVTVDGREVLTEAAGESMTGVPANTAMHFRNGAVAISYVATLLLKLAEEGTVSLDDKLSTWLPRIPHADRVTLRQLAQMTSGYVDYGIGNTAMNDAFLADPFRAWTTHDLLSYATSKPLLYEPGTNWNYAHTNYVLLGLALERATGETMSDLLSDRVLRPLGLTDTAASLNADIPSPVLHAFTSERREALRIPPDTPFYEESTFWNPSWTITHGAIQTTNIYDLEATAVGIGSGRLLKPESYRQMVSTDLRGKTRSQPGCATCRPMDERYTYGLGVVISGNWLLQNPMFAGYAGVEAYLPAQKIAIAVATTFAPEAFDDSGDYRNEAETLFRRIGAEMAPDDAPPGPAPR
ncbi:serine hydrolase domain-containing protein [Mycolicibacterium austroafricanum]|uniref:serine hydrolase domain-containing protein n=1 Tax=Mycolicibacterium austroafricanum TaxID=39687 RepID=UPI001CA30798|nr:serine hydrolase domain-containing protein [Mycolicibacterium austroafricanum]QZT65279.1 beta-lactamase family protein [Mycolicibacterium austroafricanum]